jgi:hypothetical protein
MLVALGCGADVVVIGDPHAVPQSAELGGDFVGELLRRFAGSFRGALDFLSVLIGAGQEKSIGSEQALAARNSVTGNSRVGMPDMRPRIDVINWGRDVKSLLHVNR